jgi:hypothetical protein
VYEWYTVAWMVACTLYAPAGCGGEHSLE